MIRTLTHVRPSTVPAARLSLRTAIRTVSTLSSNPHIYIHPDPSNSSTHLLSLLPSSPPNPSLAIGTTTQLPPTPASFTENASFLRLLHRVLARDAHADPLFRSQAQALATSAGGTPLTQPRRRQTTGASGASDQRGHGLGPHGGWIHVFDQRRPPDFGRIPDPEDIFGSLEVDPDGGFTDGAGRYQESGTYRVVTRDGVLGLTAFLRERVVRALEGEGG